MISISKKLRIAIVSLLVALPLMGATQVGAQEQEFTPELYTSELSGFDVEATGPNYEITGATLEHYQTGEGEIVNIEGQIATLEVSFFDDEDTPEDSIDAYLNGLDSSGIEYEELERDVVGDVTYSVVLIEYDGTEILYYMQVTEDVTGNVDLFETILTGVDFLEDDLETAQEEVTIDGNPFMETADTDVILGAVDGGAATPDDDTDTATPEAEDVDDADEDRTTTGDPAAVSVPFESAGVDLNVGGDFEVDEESLADSGIELYLLYNNDTLGVVALGETGDEPGFIVESYGQGYVSNFDSAELVDSEDNGDSAWALYEVVSDGEDRAFFVYADATTISGFETLITVESAPADLGDSIEAVQDDIDIDGEPLMADIDADEIAALAVGGEDTGDDADADVTPEATEEDDDAGASDSNSPRDDAKLPSGSDEGNSSETNRPGSEDAAPSDDDDADEEPTEEPVGQSDSWTSPLYGNEVAWDGSVWFTDLDAVELTESDEEAGYEFVTLIDDSSEIGTYLWIEFQPDTTTADEFLAYWVSDDYLQRETSDGGTFDGEVISSRTRGDSVGVVIQYSSNGEDFIMVREAVNMEDGTVMVITIDAEISEAVSGYESAQEVVTVNGDSIFTVFSLSQIERIVGE